MRAILDTVERIAVSDLGVLIVGERGTGKKWLARMIHKLSGRSDRHFVHIDCSSIPEEDIEKELLGYETLTLTGIEIKQGAFEEASGGTIFLNNVSSLRKSLQLKIARILEHQHFRRIGGFEEIRLNVRVLAVVCKDPDKVDRDEETIGRELYHRICPIIINLPPLRERRNDIQFLIESFILESGVPPARRPRGITADALKTCLTHHWPGNARELKNVIEYAIGKCREQFIQTRHLPEYLQKQSKLRKPVREETFAV